ELPLALSASMGGQPASSSGFGAGGALGLELGNWDRLAYAAELDFQYLSDRVQTEGRSSASQQLSRAGLSLRFAWLEAPPPPRYGGLVVRVIDAKTSAPI